MVEMLVVLAITSIMGLVIAAIFSAGLWEISHSSGRIELVRKGRRCIDNTQRYLASACNSIAGEETITYPTTPVDNLSGPTFSRVQFYTPFDHLVSTIEPSARTLQNAPANATPYHSYELAAVPGPNGQGQDVVLRKYLPAANPGDDPVTPDLTVAPRFIARDLGVPVDPVNQPGVYQDGFVIRYLRTGTVQLEVNLSSDTIDDGYQQATIEDRTPMRFKMTSIIQLPYYNIR